MTTKQPKEIVTLVIRGVPVKLRREFRIACLQRGFTMQDRLIEIIRADVNAHNQGKGGRDE